jgi:hypothetical protein
VTRLFHTLQLFLDDMFTSKEKNEENSKRTEIYHQRTSQQSKKEKGKARKEQRKEHNIKKNKAEKKTRVICSKKENLLTQRVNERANKLVIGPFTNYLLSMTEDRLIAHEMRTLWLASLSKAYII